MFVLPSLATPGASRFCESVAGLRAGASRSCRSVHVTVPSTWMRNECIFNSSASAAVRRMSRRVALLKVHRGAGFLGARVVGWPEADSMVGTKNGLFALVFQDFELKMLPYNKLC